MFVVLSKIVDTETAKELVFGEFQSATTSIAFDELKFKNTLEEWFEKHEINGEAKKELQDSLLKIKN